LGFWDVLLVTKDMEKEKAHAIGFSGVFHPSVFKHICDLGEVLRGQIRVNTLFI